MANNNKHTGPNVPALRFPEFSGEWSKVLLSSACEINPKTDSLDSQFLYIDLESVVKGTLAKRQIIEKDGAPSRAQRVLKENDILYQCVRPYQLNNYFFEGDTIQCVASTGYAQLRTKHNPLYVFHALHTKQFTNQVLERCTGTNYPAINSSDLGTVEVPICSLPEQEKIGSLLALIDSRIKTQSKIIEEQETLLKSLADKLISAQPANVALCECVEAKSSTMKESELESSGEFSVYGASGLCGFCSDALEESDSILITKDGSGVGTCQYATEKHSFLGTLCSLTAKENVYLPYIYYALLNFNFASYKTGQAIPHIYFKDYGKATIYCPSYVEQIRIASGLKKLDAKINADIELLKQYRLQKEFLLSRMFI